MSYILSQKEVETLITVCELNITQAFKEKIKGDEYFKRGFLLACQELKAEMIHSLKRYEITPAKGLGENQ
jgi:hypothetical protein